jgi:hypothetical protein
MKKLTYSLILAVGLVSASAVSAFDGPLLSYDQPLTPTPDPVSVAAQPPVGAIPVPGDAPVVTQTVAIPLYHCVKYRDERKIAPCAVPMIVMVKDPCAKRCDPCEPPKCVAVQICVPPCSTCPPKVVCRRGGEYVKYDFGKYRVEIRSRNGVVRVDYDA